MYTHDRISALFIDNPRIKLWFMVIIYLPFCVLVLNESSTCPICSRFSIKLQCLQNYKMTYLRVLQRGNVYVQNMSNCSTKSFPDVSIPVQHTVQLFVSASINYMLLIPIYLFIGDILQFNFLGGHLCGFFSLSGTRIHVWSVKSFIVNQFFNARKKMSANRSSQELVWNSMNILLL